jgi:hypothetical protein
MTRDDIIRMAREADVHHINLDPDYFDGLQRFAAIVAAATREECAQFLELGVDLAGMSGSPDLQAFCATLLQGCADGLRKAGQQ